MRHAAQCACQTGRKHRRDRCTTGENQVGVAGQLKDPSGVTSAKLLLQAGS
jgi:hypothetical protein